MLLTITTTHEPATDLGYLLMKHPDNLRQVDLPFGEASVFFSEATTSRCTAVLVVDIDPILLVRGHGGARTGRLSQYVNDRPYTANSMLAVAIKRIFNTAMAGKCRDRPAMVTHPIPLQLRLPVLRVKEGEKRLRSIWEPLGYTVTCAPRGLSESFPEWGESPYWDVTLETVATVRDVLTHLYVLIPVLDGDVHYYVNDRDIDNLLTKSDGWLSQHPEKTWIVQRALKRQRPLVQAALAQLLEHEDPAFEENSPRKIGSEQALEAPIRLHDIRMQKVIEEIRRLDAHSVVDLGCGEGQLLERLIKEPQLQRIVGIDVSSRALVRAKERLHFDTLSPTQRQRIDLWVGALTYRDRRLTGFDVACLIEVIEHIDPPRLPAFEKTVFAYVRPNAVILTTPNAEYNARFEGLKEGDMRHLDHRFEWTRQEFRAWATAAATRFDYRVHIDSVGTEDPVLGAPTQMAIFTREEGVS